MNTVKEPLPRPDTQAEHEPDTGTASDSTSLGTILIAQGKLTPPDAERVAEFQKRHRIRFGDAAVRMRLIKRADVQFALSQQFNYPVLSLTDPALSRELVAAYDPLSSTAEAIRALRTQLKLRWIGTAGEATQRIAVVSPSAKDGRSFIAANLALIFSQAGERTLLVDADLRTPRQHQIFNLPGHDGLSGLIAGRTRGEVIHRVSSFIDLSVLPAGAVPPNPQELLNQPRFSQLLAEVSAEFSIVIIDTSAEETGADSQIVASQSDGCLVVARQDGTRLQRLRRLIGGLKDIDAPIIGTILNRH